MWDSRDTKILVSCRPLLAVQRMRAQRKGSMWNYLPICHPIVNFNISIGKASMSLVANIAVMVRSACVMCVSTTLDFGRPKPPVAGMVYLQVHSTGVNILKVVTNKMPMIDLTNLGGNVSQTRIFYGENWMCFVLRASNGFVPNIFRHHMVCWCVRVTSIKSFSKFNVCNVFGWVRPEKG